MEMDLGGVFLLPPELTKLTEKISGYVSRTGLHTLKAIHR